MQWLNNGVNKTMKLTEMKGASLLPVKKEISTGSDYDELRNIGFNSAVTQLEQCSVEVDEEELLKIINNYLPKDWVIGRIGLAKELSKCKQNWLRLEVGK